MIKQLNSKDADFSKNIEEVIIVHKDVLFWSVLSVFGLDFLRFYYHNVPKSKSFFCSVYKHDGKIAGIITYSTNSDRILFEAIKQNPFLFLSLILKAVLRNPKKLKFVIWSIYFVLFQQKKILPDVKSEIIAFAVLPDYHTNINVAQKLFIAAVRDLDKAGVEEIKAMVVKNKTDSNKFYSRCGQITDVTFRIFGLDMVVYTLNVKNILKNPKLNY